MYKCVLLARTSYIAYIRNSIKTPRKIKFNILNSSAHQDDVKLLRAICSKWPHAKETAVQQVTNVFADISYFSASILQQILQETVSSAQVSEAEIINICLESASSQLCTSLGRHSPLKSTLEALDETEKFLYFGHRRRCISRTC